jgi:hypothetical protein
LPMYAQEEIRKDFLTQKKWSCWYDSRQITLFGSWIWLSHHWIIDFIFF